MNHYYSYSSNTNTCDIPECSRPCFERNGVVHNYCGRTHAAEAVERGMLESLKPPHGNCHHCQLYGCEEEVYFEEDIGTVHDFCCRGHANLAVARGQWPLPEMEGSSGCQLEGCTEYVYRDPVSGQESQYCSRSHAVQGEADLVRLCDHPMCSRAGWVDPSTGDFLGYCSSRCAATNGAHDLVGQSECSLPGCVLPPLVHQHTRYELGYCSDEHRMRADQRSLCPNTEPNVDRTFRGGLGGDEFRLSVLTNQHHAYASLKEQFFSKWQKPASGLTVQRIFKVQVPEHVRRKHHAYETTVSNVRRRFHGTSCSTSCNFFVDLKGGPCGRADCSVCNICRHGFQLQGSLGRTAQNTNFVLRYGEGLYFSSVSGKSNDYADKSEKVCGRGRRWRCMFMASVAVGRAFRTQEGILPQEMCPPAGYDSVVGEVGPGLNYDEVAVYHEDAALPTYLIAYSMY